MAKGLCDDAQEKTCLAEVGDALLDWTCSQCEKKKSSDISPYTSQIFRLRKLRLAGYPFKADDLTYEEWLDLGAVEEWTQWQQTKTQSRLY